MIVRVRLSMPFLHGNLENHTIVFKEKFQYRIAVTYIGDVIITNGYCRILNKIGKRICRYQLQY